MSISQFVSNLNHIGIPTDCYEETKEFYEELGCFTAFETELKEKGQRVAFLKSGNMTLEVYEEAKADKRSGAVNHFSFDCSDIENAFIEVQKKGYALISDGIEFLPFWDNGVKFFIIRGPNGENVEFCQIL